MQRDLLGIYLNDHLAGSVVALDLLDHLESTQVDHPFAKASPRLRAEIADDRRQLEQLMARLSIAQSLPRMVMAWLAEKITRLKLRLDDPHEGALRAFEILEAVSLGIEGKRGLWVALRHAAKTSSRLNGLDYQRLVRRAEEQRALVESFRESAAVAALAHV